MGATEISFAVAGELIGNDGEANGGRDVEELAGRQAGE